MTKKILDDVIKAEYDKLNDEHLSSKERSETVERLSKLIDTKREYISKTSEKQTKYLEIGSSVLMGLCQMGFTAVWLKKGFKFEETGVFVSNTFKTWAGKIKFRK